MATFKLEKVDLFKKIFSPIGNLFNIIQFSFSDQQFSFIGLNESSTVYVNCELTYNFFNEYNCEHDIKINLFFSQFDKILKNANVDSKIEIHIEETNVIGIDLINSYKQEYRLLSVESELYEDIKEPIVKKDTEIIINSYELFNIIKNISVITDDINIMIDGAGILFDGRGIYGDAKIYLKRENENIEVFNNNSYISNKYDVGLLNNILKGGNECSDKCTIIFQNEGPLKIIYPIEDKGLITYYIAPITI